MTNRTEITSRLHSTRHPEVLRRIHASERAGKILRSTSGGRLPASIWTLFSTAFLTSKRLNSYRSSSGEPAKMKMKTKILAILILCIMSSITRADDAKKLKAVMYVGGGFHDYKEMPFILAHKISEIANVSIDVKPMPTAEAMAAQFKDPQFGQGYDVIIYDICFGEKWKDGDYDPALKLAQEGKPVVFVHCAMHNYRAPRDPKAPDLKERELIVDLKWHAIVGIDTRVHDKYVGFSTVKVAAAKDHPIIKNFPDNWKTAGDEMYNTVKMMDSATPRLQATSPATGKVHTVAWTNHYGKARIFGTTLGHD